MPRTLILSTCLAILVSAVSGARDGPTFEYAGPMEDVKDPDASAFTYTKWKKGAELFLTVHDANLRAGPGLKKDVLATLPMGSKVKVVAVGRRATVLGKVDQWYQVETQTDPKRTGYLFGLVLTPAAFRADLDGDGEQEIVTVSFTADFKIRVRIREPGVDEPTHRTVDLEAAGGAYLSQRGSMVSATIVPMEKAGIGLVKIDTYVEACADFATHWVGYRVGDKKPGVLGEAKLSLSLGGLADSPMHSSYEVEFQPAKGTATEVRTNSEEDEQGKEHKEVTRTSYKLVDGVFVEQKKKK